MIVLKDLSIGYKSKRNTHVVASGINARIRGGELTCLLGTNGVGKSTFLRTLAGFQPKINGKIYVDNRELEQYTERELAQKISVVLTDRIDIHNLSTQELISMGRSPYTGFWGTLNEEDHDVVQQAIQLVGIENLAQHMVHTLSDGERQKAMIAKALVQQTPIVLLDEPTAFLDFPSKVEIMQLLHRLSRETGKTIFLSTHDLEIALQMADKVWLMSPTNDIVAGTPEDLALDGALDNFFSRQGIIFDQQSGLFRVKHSTHRKIHLEGKGLRLMMLHKALLRNGIDGSEDPSSSISIHVADDKFNLYLNNQPHASFHNIEETLVELLDLIGKQNFS